MHRAGFVSFLSLAFAIIAGGCRSTSSPEPAPDAGAFLPSSQGSTWVYTMAGGNYTYRRALGDTVIGDRLYHGLLDSITYSSAGVDTAYVGSSYFRSDEHSLYEVLAFPNVEGVFLDTREGATWTEYEDTTGRMFPRRWDYTTVALLPSFTVGSKTYPDVLQVENLESYPTMPSVKPSLYEFYYAKNVGLVAIYDSTAHILAQALESYVIR